MTPPSPDRIVASFDSATVLLRGLAAALRGEPFAHVGNPAAAAAVVRVAGRLPWPLLRPAYSRVGASEGLDPGVLGEVDLGAVADWLVRQYPPRQYPAVLVGSSNGAVAHLAAALQVPWLPATVLVPVSRRGDPGRPVDALRFGVETAAALLRRNPDVRLHHMHDQVQDELMVARMTYFRTKWLTLPPAYRTALSTMLAPGAPVVLVDDTSQWPVVQVGERHVFQPGAQGGRGPDWYAAQRHTPSTDGVAAEAEWGCPPELGESLAQWCAAHGRDLVRLTFPGPQAPAHAVATVLRAWYRGRGEPADRLLVPSFVLADPWTAVAKAVVPFWTFFSVQDALHALDDHLERSEPYRHVDVMLFQHGVRSDGIATPTEWLTVARAHGATARLLAVDPRRFPHDIASLGRYHREMTRLPRAEHPWQPLEVSRALAGLDAELPMRPRRP